jgi:hypothetical protein
VIQLHASTFDGGIAYVAVGSDRTDVPAPLLFKTSDYGQIWKSVTGDLPSTHPLDGALSVVENASRQEMLFAGTGRGLFYSMDDGGHWIQLKEGLPPAPVTSIVVEPRYHDVVVSTYGRGVFVLANISLLEQTGQTVPRPGTALYLPRPGIRQARSGSTEFLFSLGAAPTSPIQMQILDASGQLIRTALVQNARGGLNRVQWDLRYDPPRVVGPGTAAVPIAAPGKYSVRLILENRPHTQPFDVIRDPAISATDDDLSESTKMQVRIRDAVSEASELIARVDVVRQQVDDLLGEHRGQELEKPLAELNGKILGVELAKVYPSLLWLGAAVGTGTGEEAGGAEYKPRDDAYRVLDALEKQVAAAKAAFESIAAKDIPEFNRAMAGKLPEIRDR